MPSHSIYDPTNPMGKMFFNVLVTSVGMMVTYTDDIEEAYLTASRFVALMDIPVIFQAASLLAGLILVTELSMLPGIRSLAVAMHLEIY
ncbi:hypothetical protein [Photorhabdus australis]|nr:hypothetical protein [Photorhabdus australis]